MCVCVRQVCDQELLQRSSRGPVGLRYHEVNPPVSGYYFSSPRRQVSFIITVNRHSFVSAFCSRETYNALTTWLSDARMLASQNIVIILCGNKKDLDADREVTFLEASRFAQENGTDGTRTVWGSRGILRSLLWKHHVETEEFIYLPVKEGAPGFNLLWWFDFEV